jgi:hypothetical protein
MEYLKERIHLARSYNGGMHGRGGVWEYDRPEVVAALDLAEKVRAFRVSFTGSAFSPSAQGEMFAAMDFLESVLPELPESDLKEIKKQEKWEKKHPTREL